jgi:hypothetical protein
MIRLTGPSVTFRTARVFKSMVARPVGVVITSLVPSGVYPFWWKYRL